MTLEKVKCVLIDYRNMLWEKNYRPYKDHALIERHIMWMIAEALTWKEERKEKAMRWLGFIQGVLFTKGYYTIKELKEHSQTKESTNDRQ